MMNSIKRWFIKNFGHQCYACGEVRLMPWEEYCSFCDYDEGEVK